MLEVFGSKLLLGGATFGNAYGVTNSRNPEGTEAGEIVRDALMGGFVGVDTAPSYGDSETVLGSQNLKGQEVFTKISQQYLCDGLSEAVRNVEISISRLRINKLSGLTFHSSSDFLRNKTISLDLIETLLQMDLIDSWGISLYSPSEIDAIFEIQPPNYFQAPVNIVDRRFLSEQVITQMREGSVRLQARSLFLQGILLENPNNLPKYFSPWVGTLNRYQNFSSSMGVSMLSLSLCTILQSEFVHRAVVGVNSKTQLAEILEALNTEYPMIEIDALPNCNEEALIDPRNWTR
jgi:aryl-alcohol dehydrogenase-like predicted oxidoreductase